MIEIKCSECTNCTGDSCKVYGSDADKAVKRCVDDNFKNYSIRMTRQEAIEVIEELPVMRYMKINGKQSTITTALSMAIAALQDPEIVHCEYCVYAYKVDCREPKYDCRNISRTGCIQCLSSDDYCSYGEKR